MAMAMGDLNARVRNIEERMAISDHNNNAVVRELQDEIRGNTEKFGAIIKSIEALITNQKEVVDAKIELAVKELNESIKEKYVTQTAFASIEQKIEGLTTRLSTIWACILIGGYVVNWIINHPAIFSTIGGK